MTKQIGPGFQSATGYTFAGTSGDSGTLANEILAGTTLGDVFISASPSKNTLLEGTAGKNLVSWYATWSTSPLVLGYDPSSKFASDVMTKPWYQVLAEPGILIGRTDPTTDPKGALTKQVLTSAATTYNEPALAAIAASTSNVFVENTLVGRLQAHQLDVGFFYAAEAKAAGIPTVALTGETVGAMYTITILSNAEHLAGAEAFVKYLLGPAAKPALTADGFNLVTPPTVSGTGVPTAVSSVIPS
jgi:molybdate/tungstate transport system substrate-binding protein